LKLTFWQPAYIRRQQIIENTKLIAWHNQPTLRAHGLSVNPNMTKVKALILPPPRLVYGSGIVNPGDGQWNLKGVRFLLVGVFSISYFQN
jgi:eukaryotic translation initiation factor 2C